MKLQVDPDESAGKAGPGGLGGLLFIDMSGAKKDRQKWLTESLLEIPAEKRIPPKKFCTGIAPALPCFDNYAGIAQAIFGRPVKSGAAWTGGLKLGLAVRGALGHDDQPLIFCRPLAQGERGTTTEWSSETAVCSSNWMNTTFAFVATSVDKEKGEYKVPPWGCVGGGYVEETFRLPPGGEAGSGFRCRQRIFRVQIPAPGGGAASEKADIDSMCHMMRIQTWGKDVADNKYKNKAKAQDEKPFPIPDEPKMYSLTREELLYFFGHKRLYCKANRPLTHRGQNTDWTKSFVCGVPRGLVESGPFEEGVQLCATTPYVDRAFPEIANVVSQPARGRLHCWKFNRPECKDFADGTVDKNPRMTDIFDAYDILGELRRTRNASLIGTESLKEIAKEPSFEEKLRFSDTSNDSGDGGVKDFCRFDGGSMVNVVCGYDQKSMAQWFEMRANEVAENCSSGACVRGQYRRGYTCAIHTSPQVKDGKPVWLCGFDRSDAGRKRIEKATWICEGGRWVRDYQGPTGDRPSLHCSKRLFSWTTIAEGNIPNFGYWVKKWADDNQVSKLKKNLDDKKTSVEKSINAREKFYEEKCGSGSLVYSGGQCSAAPDDIAREKKRLLEVELSIKELPGGPNSAVTKDQWSHFLTMVYLATPADYAAFLGHRGAMRHLMLVDSKELPDGLRNITLLKLAGAMNLNDKKSEGLRALVKEALTGERAPDGGWYKDVRDETEEPLVRPYRAPAYLLYSFTMLLQEVSERIKNGAWGSVTKVASSPGPFMTRLELLEHARTKVPENARGPVFCIEATNRPGAFACTQTPVVLGGIMSTSGFESKGRLWCYGAIPGESSKTLSASKAFSKKAKSPWYVEAPSYDASAYAQEPGWMKCERFQYSDEVWARAKPAADAKQDVTQAGGDPGGVQSKVGGLVGFVLDFLLPKLGDVRQIMNDLANVKGELIEAWVKRYLEKFTPNWTEWKKKIDAAQQEIVKARDALSDLKVKIAGKSVKTDADEKLLEAAKDEFKKAQQDLKNMLLEFKGIAKNPGEDSMLNVIVQNVQALLAERLERFILPKARSLLAEGFRKLRSLVNPVRDAAASAVAAIPFAGGALVVAVTFVFDYVVTTLENYLADKLTNLVRSLLAKGLNAVMSPLVSSVKGTILDKLLTVCLRDLPYDLCPIKISGVPREDKWLERAIACNWAPKIGPADWERAYAAERNMEAYAAGLAREAPVFAKRFANHFLARVGHTYDSWMAATAPAADAAKRALAARLAPRLERSIHAHVASLKQSMAPKF